MITFQCAGRGERATILYMANMRGQDDFPGSSWDGFPAEVKAAALQVARATRAIDVYRRRGWDTSGVRGTRDRARARLTAVLDELEIREISPTLF